MKKLLLLALLLTPILLQPVHAAGPEDYGFEFLYEGKHWIWYVKPELRKHYSDYRRFFDYADREFEEISRLTGITIDQKAYVLIWDGGFNHGGYELTETGGKPGIIIGWTQFTGNFQEGKGYAGYKMVTHETVNMFTAKVSGNWPNEWWVDRYPDYFSPFPRMLRIDVMKTLGVFSYREDMSDESEPTYILHRTILAKGGWKAYQFLFQEMEKLGIRWEGDLREEPLRTHYIMALLYVGANRDFRSDFRAAGIKVDSRLYNDIVKAYITLAKTELIANTLESEGFEVKKSFESIEEGRELWQVGKYEDALAIAVKEDKNLKKEIQDFKERMKKEVKRLETKNVELSDEVAKTVGEANAFKATTALFIITTLISIAFAVRLQGQVAHRPTRISRQTQVETTETKPAKSTYVIIPAKKWTGLKFIAEFIKAIRLPTVKIKAYCKFCGAPLLPTAEYCPSCGKVQPGELHCRYCGSKFSKPVDVCPVCGKMLR